MITEAANPGNFYAVAGLQAGRAPPRPGWSASGWVVEMFISPSSARIGLQRETRDTRRTGGAEPRWAPLAARTSGVVKSNDS